jgi:RNA polymerase sigma factor (sigma-70 family)
MTDNGVATGLGEPTLDTMLAAGFRRDPELFTSVYERYFRAVYRYVAGRLDVQVADDIAAETFLVAFGQRDRFDPVRGSLRAWLLGIATNLVARYRRTEARHYAALARAMPEPTVGSHENRVVASVAAASMRPQLARALAGLSPGERDVVLLVALGQLSHKEVAQALGISSGTVGSRLSRARAKLHQAIGREAIDGRETDR